jgi:AraC-like DNA-binding protein
MKMNALAHASVDQLSLVSLRLERCAVYARHRYKMNPAPVERFIYITQGSVCFDLKTSEFTAVARDMVYLPGNTAYDSLWFEDSHFVVVDILLHDAVGQPIRFEEAPMVLFHDTHSVYDGLLAELARKADADGPFDWLERLSLTFKLLCEMARDTNRAEMDDRQRRIQPALSFLQGSFTEDFPIERLAAMCSLSPASFRRLFVACKGMSPVEYRSRLRIRKAAELLKTGKITVGEAAEQVGIRDVKYFSKLFLRYTGYNPGSFRKYM